MDAVGNNVARAAALLAEFGERDGSLGKVTQAVAADRGLTYHETVDFQKSPAMYVPALAALLELGLRGRAQGDDRPPTPAAGASPEAATFGLTERAPGTGVRLLHLGASHGVFCRFLQDLPGVAMAIALDLSLAALRHGRSWGLHQAVLADAVSLAACGSHWADVVLAESLYVPGYWPAAAIARSLAQVSRVLRPGGCLLIQEWGFDPARVYAPELDDAGLCEVRRVTVAAPTQQGEREVTCLAFRCSGRPQRRPQ